MSKMDKSDAKQEHCRKNQEQKTLFSSRNVIFHCFVLLAVCFPLLNPFLYLFHSLVFCSALYLFLSLSVTLSLFAILLFSLPISFHASIYSVLYFFQVFFIRECMCLCFLHGLLFLSFFFRCVSFTIYFSKFCCLAVLAILFLDH